jgi:hypothetical protein
MQQMGMPFNFPAMNPQNMMMNSIIFIKIVILFNSFFMI